MKGSILWVPYLRKFVVVIEADGRKAYVYQIYPVETSVSEPLSKSSKGLSEALKVASKALPDPTLPSRAFKMSLLLEGFYLEQIHGVPIVSLYYRPKRIHNLRSDIISELSNVQLEKSVQRI